MSKKRRTLTSQEKAEIVLEILRKENTFAEIARKHEIAQPVLSRWKTAFLSNMSSVFDKNEKINRTNKLNEINKDILCDKMNKYVFL